MTGNVKINCGLKGVYFERSGVSGIDGAAGKPSYRGYSIHDQATRLTCCSTATRPPRLPSQKPGSAPRHAHFEPLIQDRYPHHIHIFKKKHSHFHMC